jgi:FHA domain-containing protein
VDAASLPMIPIPIYRKLCDRYDAREFAKRYPEPVLVQLALGSQMLTATSPRETVYRAKGLGTRRRSARATGSAYYAYRIRRKRLKPGARVSVGFLRTNDVIIQEATISRVHAYIERGASGYVVIEAGSSNGVKVNDTKVNLGQSVPVRSGDRIAFGNVSTLFMMPEDLHSFVRRVV